MKFTWSDQKSIILTRAVVAGTIAGCGIMTVSGPWLTRWMVSAHALPPASGPVLLGMGYVCAVLAFVMLVSLYKFLRRIEAVGDALDRNAQNSADDHRKDNGQHGVHTRRAKGKEHNIAANHDNVAVGEVQHLGNAVDHRIAQGDQRVNAAQTDTVDQVG